MTIRTPARFIGRCAFRPTDPVSRDLPARCYAGPAMHIATSRPLADAMGQIAVTFSGAEHLATVQLDGGRWAAVATC